jgi:hypothetical protein
MPRLALFLVLVPALAFAKTDTSSLESKTIAALGDIAKAKSALDLGNDKSGDSWLTKAKTLLSAVLQKQSAPQAQQTPQTQTPAQQQGAQQQQPTQEQNPGLLARAESAAQKLGTSAQDQSTSSGPSGAVSDLKSVYDKVTLAQSLLHKGDSTQAKSILDDIPTSPADALKLLHH